MPDYKKKLGDLVQLTVAQGASDLHLGEDIEPIIRTSGALTPILSEQKLTHEDLQGFLDVMLTPEQKNALPIRWK